jgi:hypothetical protein
MVIVKPIKPINFTMANNELRLDSNRLIHFTAPPCVDMVESTEDQYAIRKRSGCKFQVYWVQISFVHF